MSLVRSLVSLLSLVGLFVIAPASTAQAAKCPNVHIVLDRSGSMSSTVTGTGKTRMVVANDAIKAILGKYDGKFPIGLSRFPRSSCDSEVIAAPAYKTRMMIEASLTPTTTGSTPSGTAMRDAAAIKELRDPDRKQYIVLITDGGPGCGGEPDSCPGTTAEIRKASMQNPPITTFVVGFGGGLGTSEQQCLRDMADAGGKPDPMNKYYKADSADDLNKALASIIEIITGGGDVGMGGLCDDTCYSNGCSNPGDICVRGECKQNPCADFTCAPGSYCFTDGLTAPSCVKACAKSCPAGTRCYMGGCSPDPCNYACPAGLVCDASLRRCVKDPLCGEMPIDEQCRGTSSCKAGQCVDDPCRYIRCPANTRCVGWEGSCDVIPSQPMMTTDPKDNTVDVDGRGGCSALPGAAGSASLGSGLLLALALLSARRRRSA